MSMKTKEAKAKKPQVKVRDMKMAALSGFFPRENKPLGSVPLAPLRSASERHLQPRDKRKRSFAANDFVYCELGGRKLITRN